MLLGVSLSTTGIWGWRLLAIIGTISVLSVIASNFVLQSRPKTQTLALLLLIVPFSVPVFGSIFLEVFGPIDVGVILANKKNMNYEPPRWLFLTRRKWFRVRCSFVSVFYYRNFLR